MNRKPILVSKATHDKLAAMVATRKEKGHCETLGSMVDKIVERIEPER